MAFELTVCGAKSQHVVAYSILIGLIVSHAECHKMKNDGKLSSFTGKTAFDGTSYSAPFPLQK